VTQHLDDTNLLAEVACFNQDNPRLNDLHCRARRALLEHIDRLSHRYCEILYQYRLFAHNDGE
jgi:hypothetical protein